MPNAYTQPLNLFGEEKHGPSSPEYRRVAEGAVRDAIADWLKGIDANRMHLFKADGVECALECFPGHWGAEARWRWGRLNAGDPDEDESGENVLLLIALGCPLAPGGAKRAAAVALPPYAEGDLTLEEVAAAAQARAEANLGKLALHPLP